MHSDVFQSARSSCFEPEQWLWCLHCERFFQGRDARPDRVGGMQGCAFSDCDGAGYYVDVFDWDAWPVGNPSAFTRWPAREDLRKGLFAAAWTESDEAEPYDPWGPGRPEGGFVRNDDHGRRDEILATMAREYDPDMGLFAGLDLCGLATLVRERFIAPWDRDGVGAPVEECLCLLASFPEATLGGRVMPETRTGSTVAFDFVACDLAGLSDERREAVVLGIGTSCVEGGSWSETDEAVVGWWEERRAD